jgi:hypothetical protein
LTSPSAGLPRDQRPRDSAHAVVDRDGGRESVEPMSRETDIEVYTSDKGYAGGGMSSRYSLLGGLASGGGHGTRKILFRAVHTALNMATLCSTGFIIYMMRAMYSVCM